jgi:hypothetical protein
MESACAAAGVTVQFRRHDAGDAECFVEMRRDADRLLAGRGIGDKQHFLWLKELELLDFDQHRVDLLPAGGVENLDVATLFCRPIETMPAARFRSFR